MKTVDDYNFSGKKALVRVDLNVPLDKSTFQVTDDTRLRAPLKTIKKILYDGGSVILMSHLGRPKNGPEDKFSLRHVKGRLSELLEKEVTFLRECTGKEVSERCAMIEPGDVILLENLRFHPEEESGEKEFARTLASYGDVYVNDAFGTAHRRHASTAVVAEFFPDAKMFGYVMANELNNAKKVLESPQRPFTAITGGAKVSDKILILENLIDKVDNLIIGGGMSYTFIKARGGNIGSSICEDDKIDLASSLLLKAKEKGVNILLPEDSVAASEFSDTATTRIVSSDAIPDGWMGLDIGPKAIQTYKSVIMDSKTILWNGPMGVFEMTSFQNGTREIALATTEATMNGAFSLIGGGDSAAAVNKFGLSEKVSYVSTGGGALLEYLEGKTLPGVAMIIQ
jgi:phosphoglycerate kinase